MTTATKDAKQDRGHTERVEVFICGPGAELDDWARDGLEGTPTRLLRAARLPGESDPMDPPDADPDLALVGEEASADFASRLGEFKHRFPRCQILLIGSEDSGLNPRRLGPAVIRHWFFRPLSRDALLSTLRAAARSLSRTHREQERRTRARVTLEAFLGTSPALRETLELARRVAQSPTTSVLILGETGTGKGMLARAIHGESPLRDGPFMEINCAAIPGNLIESELFGHQRGAFTSATRDKPGLLELADGGTAFLDEVGELDSTLQVKLLKFLDDGALRRLAATSSLKVQVRMISATNRDLEREVREGSFRLDLFHRLGVVALRVPPLRERPEDIPLLAERYLEDLSRRHRDAPLRWSPEALAALGTYAWPGNVRELINLVERLVLLAPEGEVIGLGDLPAGLVPVAPVLRFRPGDAMPEVALPPEGVSFDAVERAVLEAALRQADGNVTRAAALLGMGRGGLRYRLERLGVTAGVSRRRSRPMGRRRPRAA